MNLSIRRTKDGIRHNTRVKRFADGSAEILTCNNRVFLEKGWEQPGKWDRRHSQDPLLSFDSEQEYAGLEREAKLAEDDLAVVEKTAASKLRAQRRARSQVRDLALCNDFRYFVTLTLDRRRVDRHDVAAVTRKLNQWLDNQVRRHGLQYILVPELHKDGAVHFHGFFNAALRVVDSGTVIPPDGGKPRRPRGENQRIAWLEGGGHVVYNLPQWSLGFTTAIELYGDYRAAVGYVCKYISKEQTKVGGRWFYHGGDLRRPEVELLDLNIEDVEAVDGAATFETPTLTGARFAVLRVDGVGGAMHGRDEQRGKVPGRTSGAGLERQREHQGSGSALYGRDAAAGCGLAGAQPIRAGAALRG